ncbi:hypothetical protein II906_05690, partial [bacterium]|nr:hypothetical protein [bacterium]
IIAINPSSDDMPLFNCLADTTGGKFIPINSFDAIKPAVSQIFRNTTSIKNSIVKSLPSPELKTKNLKFDKRNVVYKKYLLEFTE